MYIENKICSREISFWNMATSCDSDLLKRDVIIFDGTLKKYWKCISNKVKLIKLLRICTSVSYEQKF